VEFCFCSCTLELGVGVGASVDDEHEVVAVFSGVVGVEVAAGVEEGTFTNTGLTEVGVGVEKSGCGCGCGPATSQVPCGSWRLLCSPAITSCVPGFGKITLVPSSVPHPLPMLALKISGRASKADLSVF